MELIPKSKESPQRLLTPKEAAPLLTPTQAAAILGVSVGTLQVWRCTRRYPLPFVKIGRKAMYQPEAIQAFIESRTVTPAEV